MMKTVAFVFLFFCAFPAAGYGMESRNEETRTPVPLTQSCKACVYNDVAPDAAVCSGVSKKDECVHHEWEQKRCMWSEGKCFSAVKIGCKKLVASESKESGKRAASFPLSEIGPKLQQWFEDNRCLERLIVINGHGVGLPMLAELIRIGVWDIDPKSCRRKKFIFKLHDPGCATFSDLTVSKYLKEELGCLDRFGITYDVTIQANQLNANASTNLLPEFNTRQTPATFHFTGSKGKAETESLTVEPCSLYENKACDYGNTLVCSERGGEPYTILSCCRPNPFWTRMEDFVAYKDLAGKSSLKLSLPCSPFWCPLKAGTNVQEGLIETPQGKTLSCGYSEVFESIADVSDKVLDDMKEFCRQHTPNGCTYDMYRESGVISRMRRTPIRYEYILGCQFDCN